MLWPLPQASEDPRAQPHITVLDGPRFLYPVCQVPHEVEEEVVLRHADDLRKWPFQSPRLSSSSTEFSDFLPQGFLAAPSPERLAGSQRGVHGPAPPAPLCAWRVSACSLPRATVAASCHLAQISGASPKALGWAGGRGEAENKAQPLPWTVSGSHILLLPWLRATLGPGPTEATSRSPESGPGTVTK